MLHHHHVQVYAHRVHAHESGSYELTLGQGASSFAQVCDKKDQQRHEERHLAVSFTNAHVKVLTFPRLLSKFSDYLAKRTSHKLTAPVARHKASVW